MLLDRYTPSIIIARWVQNQPLRLSIFTSNTVYSHCDRLPCPIAFALVRRQRENVVGESTLHFLLGPRCCSEKMHLSCIPDPTHLVCAAYPRNNQPPVPHTNLRGFDPPPPPPRTRRAETYKRGDPQQAWGGGEGVLQYLIGGRRGGETGPTRPRRRGLQRGDLRSLSARGTISQGSIFGVDAHSRARRPASTETTGKNRNNQFRKLKTPAMSERGKMSSLKRHLDRYQWYRSSNGCLPSSFHFLVGQ